MIRLLRTIRWRKVAGIALGTWIVFTGSLPSLPQAQEECSGLNPRACEPDINPCLVFDPVAGHLWTCEAFEEVKARRER